MIGTIVIAIVIIFLSLTIFRRPLGCLLRLLFNTLGGFALLLFINFFGQFVGINLELNLLNAVIVGILGLPGVGLLLILPWILGG